MKKIVFLISLLFATVCYAAPPPDPVPIDGNQVSFVVDQVQDVDVTVYAFEAQEVAFVDIGNAVDVSAGNDMFIEFESIKALKERPVTFTPNNLNELRKPPSLMCNDRGNLDKSFPDKQNSNNGYPFAAN